MDIVERDLWLKCADSDTSQSNKIHQLINNEYQIRYDDVSK